MQVLSKLRIVSVDADGVRPLADAMMLLADDERGRAPDLTAELVSPLAARG